MKKVDIELLKAMHKPGSRITMAEHKITGPMLYNLDMSGPIVNPDNLEAHLHRLDMNLQNVGELFINGEIEFISGIVDNVDEKGVHAILEDGRQMTLTNEHIFYNATEAGLDRDDGLSEPEEDIEMEP